jgi:hypothetical protein
MLEPAPALLQRLDPQVGAAQLQQVEGVEEYPVVVGLAVQLGPTCGGAMLALLRRPFEPVSALADGLRYAPVEGIAQVRNSVKATSLTASAALVPDTRSAAC